MKNYKAEIEKIIGNFPPFEKKSSNKIVMTNMILNLIREIVQEATKLQSLPARIHAEEGNSRPRKGECPWCWEKEGGYHTPDCKWNEIHTQNNTRSEILSNVEELIK